MSGAKISTWPVLVSRFLHLTGGLQAMTHASGHLILYPTTKKETVEVGSSAEKGYSSLFSVLGLDYFGYEEVFEENGIKYSRWNFHTPDYGSGDLVVQIWRQIAYTAMRKWSPGDEEIPQYIAFSLRASILRIRDISRQYQFQNIYATHKQIAEGRQFSNLEVFDLYMNLHSALVEMCSARDYLARFISQRILRRVNADDMASLYRRIKTGAADHPIKEMILCICDQQRPDG
jgi:hypothetical protein